ncbi:hypothetical protein DSO57_1027893 [Entomophthora muscae]|uniref:Uncharacterized protein n=1 Tax=Entomophthora muscae TaxID=34485 RepID=A0ACC2TDV1_9FUNG|nr:hypothetical protein DSO57_1027893 [Entomophthora muscae]
MDLFHCPPDGDPDVRPLGDGRAASYQGSPVLPGHAPKCTPGCLLHAGDGPGYMISSTFLSPSRWTPLLATILAQHWMASWWGFSPGWERSLLPLYSWRVAGSLKGAGIPLKISLADSGCRVDSPI